MSSSNYSAFRLEYQDPCTWYMTCNEKCTGDKISNGFCGTQILNSISIITARYHILDKEWIISISSEYDRASNFDFNLVFSYVVAIHFSSSRFTIVLPCKVFIIILVPISSLGRGVTSWSFSRSKFSFCPIISFCCIQFSGSVLGIRMIWSRVLSWFFLAPVWFQAGSCISSSQCIFHCFAYLYSMWFVAMFPKAKCYCIHDAMKLVVIMIDMRF